MFQSFYEFWCEDEICFTRLSDSSKHPSEARNRHIFQQGMKLHVTLDIKHSFISCQLKNKQDKLNHSINFPKSWNDTKVKYLQFGVRCYKLPGIDTVQIKG